MIESSITNYPPNLFYQQRQDVQTAIQLLQQSQKNRPTGVFTQLNKAVFCFRLRLILEDPYRINQYILNLCGPASFVFVWVQKDPLGFAQCALQLFDQGKVRYHGLRFRVPQALRKNNIPQAYAVEWVVLSAIQHGQNTWGYHPSREWLGLRGITLPRKINKWLEALPYTQVTMLKKPTAQALTQAWKAGQSITLLTHREALKDYPPKGANLKKKVVDTTARYTGDHYFQLASEIMVDDQDNLSFYVWNWGRHDYYYAINRQLFQKTIKRAFIVC